jgi:hypothetical protein
MRLLVFAKNELLQHITGMELNTEPTGLHTPWGKRLPNKGGIVAKLVYRETSLCFVCTHLAAHEGHEHCLDRNEHAQRVQAGARVGDREVDLGSQFDHVFWAGDLNYRVNVDPSVATEHPDKWNWVKSRIDNRQWAEIFEREELTNEIYFNHVRSTAPKLLRL